MSNPSFRLVMVLAGAVSAVSLVPSARGDDPPAATPSASTPDAPRPSDSPEKYELKFKFRERETARYEVSAQSEVTTVKGDIRQTVKSATKTRRSLTVKEASPQGTGTLEPLIEWVHMVAEFGDGVTTQRTVEFQSDSPTKPPKEFHAVFDTVGRRQAQIVFSPMGRPLEVKAIDPGQPLNPNAGAAPGSDASHERYLMPLPPAPIAVGEGWFEREDIAAREENLTVRIAIKRNYTLTAVKDGLATIDFRTAILTPVQNPTVQLQLTSRQTAGKITFDVERGLIVSRDVKVDEQVLGPFGEGSSFRTHTTFREKLLSPLATAERTAPATDGATR